MYIGPRVQSHLQGEKNHINKLLIIPGHLGSFIGSLHQAKQSPKLPCPHPLIPQSCSSHKALSWLLRSVSGKASSGQHLALPLLPSLKPTSGWPCAVTRPGGFCPHCLCSLRCGHFVSALCKPLGTWPGLPAHGKRANGNA